MENTFNRFVKQVFLVLFSFIFLYDCTKRPPKISEIKVADFGAMPNDGQNDTPAILSAIDACRENVKLVFELGIYDIHGGQENERGRFEPSFDVRDIKNLTIEGNGAELIGHDYSTMFHFSECENLKIQNVDGGLGSRSVYTG